MCLVIKRDLYISPVNVLISGTSHFMRSTNVVNSLPNQTHTAIRLKVSRPVTSDQCCINSTLCFDFENGPLRKYLSIVYVTSVYGASSAPLSRLRPSGQKKTTLHSALITCFRGLVREVLFCKYVDACNSIQSYTFCRDSLSSCAASSSTGRLKRIRAQRSLRYSSGP